MFKPELIRRILRFGVVGVVVTLVFMGLNWCFAPRLGVNLAYLAAYPLAVALHFCLSKWWTFRDQGAVRPRQLSEYLAMMVTAFLIQTAVFKALTHFTALPSWMAAGVATVAQMALAFLVMQFRVFKVANGFATAAKPADPRPRRPAVAGNPARRRWLEGVGVALIAAAIISLYTYLATSHVARAFELTETPVDYYNYLIDGFRAGQLAMKVDPAPELALMANPYDPQQRLATRHAIWHDVSYYRGRYYLYFGVAPALTLFLPFRVLTGWYLPEVLAAPLFCAGGFLASLVLFLALRRRFFPEAAAGVVWLGTLMLGLGNFCVVMLTRSQFYEVPIASAYFFSCLGLGMLYLATCAQPGRRRWLWLASLAFGLAVASRPHFVFASAVLGLMWGWRVRTRAGQPGGIRAALADAVAVGVPLGLILLGLFIYNYERFGSIFEFGQKYQLAGSNQTNMKLLDWRSVPANFYYYFWAPAQFERYFPFVDAIRSYPGTLSSYYYGIEDPYGMFANLPCLWLALAAPVIWFARESGRRELGLWLLLCCASFGAICVFTLFFVSATNRYMVDFLPSLLLVASVGLLLAYRGSGWSRGKRWTVRAILAGMVLYSGFFSVMAAFRHNGLFEHHQPAAFTRIGRWFNLPTGLWERWVGEPTGPVELTVRFPRDKMGTTEPLVVTGVGTRSDFVYVYYTGDGLIQIGGTHLNDILGRPAARSQPISVDYDVPHRIGIRAGALYPPAGHIFFSGWAPEAVRQAKETLYVTVDDVPYLNSPQAYYDATPGNTSFGVNHVSDYAGRKFTGQMLRVKRGPLSPAITPFAGDAFVRLGLKLPLGQVGRREPLIATGNPGAGDLLFVSYEDDTHVRLGFQHTGSEPLLSEPLQIVPGEIQLLDASLGSFYPRPMGNEERDLSHALIVRFNRRLVWAQEQPFHPADQGEPVFGRNDLGNAVTSKNFSGEVVGRHSLPAAENAAVEAFKFSPYWTVAGKDPAYGALRLHVILPVRPAGTYEPLLVTGPSVGQADYLWLFYVNDRQVIIGYENTGGGGPRSELITLDRQHPVDIEIELPSLYPPETDPYFLSRSPLVIAMAKDRARIKVNDVRVIDARVKWNPSTPAQSTPLENRLTTTFGKRFTGTTALIERASWLPPAGFPEEAGRLKLVVGWPDDAMGKTETILATGSDSDKNLLQVKYESPAQARFLVTANRKVVLDSGPVEIAPGGRHELKIAWGGLDLEALRPAKISPELWHKRERDAEIWLDGRPVLQGALDFTRAAPQEVGIGNAGPEASPFSGQIYEVRREPLLP